MNLLIQMRMKKSCSLFFVFSLRNIVNLMYHFTDDLTLYRLVYKIASIDGGEIDLINNLMNPHSDEIEYENNKNEKNQII